MSENFIKKYQIYLILLFVFVGLLAAGFFLILFADPMSKIIDLILIGVYLLLFLSFLSQKWKEYKIYKTSDGVFLFHPKFLVAFITLSISSILMLIFNIQLFENAYQSKLSLLMISCIIASFEIESNGYSIIVFNSHAIYFKHRWISYKDIDRMESDQSIKRNVGIYLFSDKCYSQILKRNVYEHFIQVMKQYNPSIIIK